MWFKSPTHLCLYLFFTVFSAGGTNGAWCRKKWVIAFVFQAWHKVIVISLAGCFQEAEPNFSEKQPDNEASSTYANILRPSSPLPNMALYSQSLSPVKTLPTHIWVNIKYFHMNSSSSFLSVSIIDGKRGYLFISKHHIQRFGFEWQYKGAGLVVGSLAPPVGGTFSLLLLLSDFTH